MEKRLVPGKGWGVFPKLSRFHKIRQYDYVAEYVGAHISVEEGEKRRLALEAKGDKRCYIFEVQHGKKKVCIDATEDDGRLGRLINHSRLQPNLRRTVLCIGEELHLFF